MVYNASIYGIDEAEFAHQIQVGVAASTSVGPAEHKPQGTTQVLIQGNQVSFVCKLLLGKSFESTPLCVCICMYIKYITFIQFGNQQYHIRWDNLKWFQLD